MKFSPRETWLVPGGFFVWCRRSSLPRLLILIVSARSMLDQPI